MYVESKSDSVASMFDHTCVLWSIRDCVLFLHTSFSQTSFTSPAICSKYYNNILLSIIGEHQDS